ncbi:MAG: hypothetical protein AAF628_07330 [Planctomycetota bacterium]
MTRRRPAAHRPAHRPAPGGAWLLAAVLAGCAASPPVLDLDGQRQRPLTLDGASAHVLVFIATDCPIANSYAPELRRLVEAHRGRPVRFYLVHADPEVDAAAAREHAAAYELAGLAPVLLDRDRALLRFTGAGRTPEAVVLDAAGVAYRGRIDDRWDDLGVRRVAATQHDLRDAIAAVLAGQAVPQPWPEAVGCDVPWQ